MYVEYKVLLEKAKQHFGPHCLAESIASFIAQLLSLVMHCKCSDMLEDILYNQIVCNEAKLTFAKTD